MADAPKKTDFTGFIGS